MNSPAIKNRFDKEEIKRAAEGQWPSILQQHGFSADVLTGQNTACPKCGGHDRFRLIDEQAGAVYCNQCFSTDNGDGFAAICWMTGCTFPEAVHSVALSLGITNRGKSSKSKSETHQEPAEDESAETPPALPDARLHHAYSFLLNRLSLADGHRSDLLRRGLSPESIESNGYRTMYAEPSKTMASILHREFNGESVSIPGYYVDEKTNEPRLAYQFVDGKPVNSLLLIPCRNVESRVLSLKERINDPKWLADPKRSKYLYLSSAKRGGRKANQIVHVPKGTPRICETVRITEGELKADVTFALSGIPTISIPGVNSWRKVLPVLKQLEAKIVQVAFDADCRKEPAVARSLKDLFDAIRTDYETLIEMWEPEDGKGIDDVLLAGKPTKLLNNVASTAFVEECFQSSGAAKLQDERKSKKSATGSILFEIDDPKQLATGFLELHSVKGPEGKDHSRYLLWQTSWWHWNGCCYKAIEVPQLQAYVIAYIQNIFEIEARERLEEYNENRKTPKEGEKEEKPPTCRKVKRSLVADVMLHLEAAAIIPESVEPGTWIHGDAPAGLDDPRQIVVCKNGMLHLGNLVSGQEPYLFPPHPGFFGTSTLGVEFDPNAPQPTRWHQFLEEVWPDDNDSAAALQEIMGNQLVSDTKLQKISMLIGASRSGKGTIIRVIEALNGRENIATPSLPELSDSFGLWPLLGKSIAIIGDGRISNRSDPALMTERLLKVSGEDTVLINRKNLPQINTRLKVRILIATNELPKFFDSSNALAERFVILRLMESFLGREDSSLSAKLETELPGILLWAICGWERLRQQGRFTEPESGLEMKDKLRQTTSPVGAFVEECCDVANGPDYWVEKKTLYEAWKQWCIENGRDTPGTVNQFGINLYACVPKLIDGRRSMAFGEDRPRVYKGLRIKPF